MSLFGSAPLFVTHRRGRLALAALVIATLTGSAIGQPAPAALAATTPIMWGAWVGNTPLDSAALDAFEQQAGKRQSIIHFGQPWWKNNSYVPFRAADFEAIRNRGAVPLLDWGSWDYSKGTNQPDFQLADITGGRHDAFLIQFAQSAKAWGHPFFLRLNPEMNGWWLPWSEQVNGNQPGEFAPAWRHVVDVFRAQGATNVTWVWCPNVSSPRATPIANLYPGQDYVDWTGLDGYNWGTDLGNKWQTFDQVFAGSDYNGNHNSYQQVLDVAPGKPMMIGETGTSRDGGDPGAWVRDALSAQLPTNFPQVKALVWFNWNAGDVALDWPIENTAATRQAFAESIGSSYFAGSDFRDLPVGAIAPVAPSPVADVVVEPAPVEAAMVAPDEQVDETNAEIEQL
jgi:hypothetical protein